MVQKKQQHGSVPHDFNPIALKMAKTPLSFGHSECSRVNEKAIRRQIKLLSLEAKAYVIM